MFTVTVFRRLRINPLPVIAVVALTQKMRAVKRKSVGESMEISSIGFILIRSEISFVMCALLPSPFAYKIIFSAERMTKKNHINKRQKVKM